MRTWLRRLAFLFRQSRHDAELREEIEAHRALRALHLEREGLSPPDAADESRRAIGNVTLAREEAREVWLGSWDTWWQDLRYGLRTLRHSPTFTVVAVVTLALGIGLNAGIFTVLNGILFRDLPAPDSHQLVSLQQAVTGVQESVTGIDTFSTAEYRAYRDRTQTFTGVLAYSNSPLTTIGGDAPQVTLGTIVSCNYFEVLQQPSSLGRPLVAGDCEPGAPPAVVLGHDLWTRTFASDAGIVGRTIELNRRPFTVVGVAAPSTYGGGGLRTGYFAPISAEPLLRPNNSRYDKGLWLSLIGRRSNGAALEQVRAELAIITAQLDRERPGRTTMVSVEPARPMAILPRDASLTAAAVVMTAFGFILLIACSNVANLMLARGTARNQEIAIRLSLGASRARVVRQLLTESLLISIAGGLLGCVLALWSFQSLIGLVLPVVTPPEFPMITLAVDMSPDYRVIAFAVAMTFATGILFGLMPALHASRPDLNVVIKQDAAGAGTSRRGGRLRATLVGVQVALCMTLMIAAGLLVRGLYVTYTVDPGFEYRNVAFVSLEAWLDSVEPQRLVDLRQRLKAGVEALPGIEAVAYADQEPLGDDFAAILIRLPAESKAAARISELTSVTPDYFSVIGLPIVRGRTFTEPELGIPRSAVRPVIVTESTARNLWSDKDPIGRTLLWGDETLQVIGVAADAQVSAVGRIDPYHVYVPGGTSVMLVKSRTDLSTTTSSIQAVARRLDPTLVTVVLPLEATLGFWRGLSATVTTLAGGLGLLALVLASVGIYGVVSYAVTGRYREVGIRLALGATARSVLGLLLRRTMRPVVVGAVIGLTAAAAFSRILSAVLFGVSPADPVGLGGAAALVMGVAFTAGVLAARPATRADPTTTLRC
jgi:predicted permease